MAAVIASVGAPFGYVGGWWGPHRLTPAKLGNQPQANSGAASSGLRGGVVLAGAPGGQLGQAGAAAPETGTFYVAPGAQLSPRARVNDPRRSEQNYIGGGGGHLYSTTLKIPPPRHRRVGNIPKTRPRGLFRLRRQGGRGTADPDVERRPEQVPVHALAPPGRGSTLTSASAGGSPAHGTPPTLVGWTGAS